MFSLIVRSFATVLLSAGLSFVPYSSSPDVQGIGLLSIADAPVVADPFSGYPILKEICACESNLTHYTPDGGVLRGRVNQYDIGICQINELYHGERIDALGIDIYTKEGNILFARDLYERQGTAPWIWSKSCWEA